jgi:flagellar basal-body rod protein FlgB
MALNFQSSLFGGKINNLTGTLGLRLARHDMSATNLANMDTPGFRAKHLNFEKVLANELMSEPGELQVRATDAKHMNTKNPDHAFSHAASSVRRSPYGWDEYDDDILDIDKEMTLLTKNQLIYNTTVQMLAKSFEGLKEAMGNGGM